MTRKTKFTTIPVHEETKKELIALRDPKIYPHESFDSVIKKLLKRK